ncbi:LPS export ABC transporter periplasmic protein LptC [bacterium]|nr:LPS export ABC transporter periplasmic protein LptC [bacterium]
MKKFLLVLFGLLFIIVLLGATPPEDKDEEEREIEFHFTKAKYDYKTKTYVFTKGELIDAKEKAKVEADEIVYNEETEKATAKGNLKFTDEENEITALSLEVDLKEKIVVLNGEVRVVNIRKKKEEEKKEEKKEGLKKYWKEKTILKCEKITYNYKDKIAYLEDKVVVTQEDKELVAQKVTWLGKEDKIILEGDVKFKDEKGQTMNCSKMVIYTKEDNEWIEIEGPLSGIFKVKEKKESSSQD